MKSALFPMRRRADVPVAPLLPQCGVEPATPLAADIAPAGAVPADPPARPLLSWTECWAAVFYLPL